MFDDVHYTAQLFCGPYVRIVSCIAQVNMQAYWDLPKPRNYSHDVLVSGICFKSSRVVPLPATGHGHKVRGMLLFLPGVGTCI